MLTALILLMGGVNGAWAAKGDVTTNVDIDFSNPITGTYSIAGAVGSMTWTKQWTMVPNVTDGILRFGNFDGGVVELQNNNIRSKDVVTISFDMAFGKLNKQHVGFELRDADNNSLLTQWFDAYNGDFDDNNPLNLNWDYMYHANNTVLQERCVNFTIRINYDEKTITTNTRCLMSGSGKPATDGEFSASWSTNTPIAKFVLTGNINIVDRYSTFDNLKITTTEGDYSAATADYTVKFMCGNTEIKDAVTLNGDVDADATLLDAHKQNFTTTDATKRYIYVSDDADGKTIAEDGSTVVIVTFREAEKWAYTITSGVDGTTLPYTATDSVWEDQNVITVPYPRYQANGTILVEKNPNGNDLQQNITVTNDGVTIDLPYTAVEGVDNLYLLSEAENLETTLQKNATTFTSRVSNGLIIHGAKGDLLTLPAGKYKFTLGTIGGDNSSHMVNYVVYKEATPTEEGAEHNADNIIIEGTCTGNFFTSFTSDEFEINEQTTISFTCSDPASNRGIDLVYVQKTGLSKVEILLADVKTRAQNAIRIVEMTDWNGLSDSQKKDLEYFVAEFKDILNTETATVEQMEDMQSTIYKRMAEINDLQQEAQTNVLTARQNLQTLINEAEGAYEEDKVGSEELATAIADAQTAAQAGIYNDMLAAAVTLREKLDDYYVANTETVTLTADMFYNWDGFGADAKKTAKANVDFNIGNDLQSGNVVVGNSEVLSAVYADLTGSFKLQFEGTAGLTLRLLFNRQGDEKDENNQNLTPPDEIQCTIGSDGTTEVFLPNYYNNKFIHLNGIKIGWGSNGTVSSIKIVRFPLSIDSNEYLLDTDFASLANWTAYTSNGFNDKGNGNIGTYRVKDGVFSPAATVDDSHLNTEYCLGLEARWSSNFVSYYQETTVALPEGVYTLTYDVENVNANTNKAVYGNLFYVQVGDTKYTDESTEWMSGKSSWTTHTIQFPIEQPAKATVSLGYGMEDNNFAQENSPVLYVSHLNLAYKSFEEIAAEELAAAKDALQEEINAANLLKDNKYYTEGKDQFVADLTTAQGALEATVIDDVNAAIDNLKQAEQTYIAANMDGQFDGETGKYILVNVATSKSWGAGNSWGTQASLVEHPEYVTLNKQANDIYQIESQVSNGGTAYYFNGDFMDNDSPVSLTITKIKEPLGYVDDNETLPYYAYIIANGNNVFGYDGETTVLGKNLDIRSEVGFERAMWVVVSLDDAKAQLSNATKEDPVDATFLLADPNFGRNNRNVAMWYGTFEVGGNNINNNAQSYMKMFDVSQTLTEIPNGMYKVGAQASVTFHDNRTIKEYDGNGYPVIFANDITANFFEMQTDDKLTNQSRLSEQFSAGVYQIEPILVKVTDGTLTLGAKSDRADIWAVWDNFQLTYLGLVPEAPVFSPGSTSFVESLSVELNCVTEGAKIYYTTDGTNPTADSKEYTEPIVISEATTIKAIAVKNGFESEAAEAIYTIAQGSTINLAITKLGPTTGSYDLSSGKSNPLHLHVKNNGDAPTNDFIVKYYKNDDVEPFNTVNFADPEVNISPIAVGGELYFDINLEDYLKNPGEYTLRAELVSDNDISPDDNVFDSSVTIYMLGDANVNGEVTTSDAVATVSYVLELLVPDKVQKLSADVDRSNTITVSDAVSIVNIAMNVEPEAEARGEEPAVNYLTMENKEIGLVNSTGFSAFQMDVTLSDGTMLGGARQTERTAGMLLKTNKIGSNTWRIVALSLDGSAISGSEGSLLSLDIVGQGSVSVSNVEFADRAARAYKLDFESPTGINSLYNNKVEGEVYSVSGARINSMKKGVNVVRQADGKVRKVLVK